MTKIAFITGASGGVGQAATKLFLDHGWTVVATARDMDSLGTLGISSRLTPLRLDVTDHRSIQEAVGGAIARHGCIDVLVNNAGFSVSGPLEGVSDEAMRRAFDTNFFGSAALIREVLPCMRERRSGTIVNVTSLAGRVGIPYLSVYCATKFALEGLTESLAHELSRFGLRVKLVEPGGIRTKFRSEWFEPAAYQPEVSQVKAVMEAGIQKAAPPEGVAEAIYRAATDNSARIRYAANGAGLLLALRKLLSDSAMQALLRRALLKE